MKALVVRQPWASLIAHGIKTIETRGFMPRTSLEPGDQLAIVAGKAPGGWGADASDAVQWCVHAEGAAFENWPRGSVVAVVTFGAAWPVLAESDGRASGHWANDGRHLIGFGSFPVDFTAELPLGDFTPGRHGWLLSNPQRLAAPVPCPAKRPDGTRTVMQGVFTLPDDVLEQVLPQIKEAS